MMTLLEAKIYIASIIKRAFQLDFLSSCQSNNYTRDSIAADIDFNL